MVIIFLIIIAIIFIGRLLIILESGTSHSYLGSSEKLFDNIVTTFDKILGVKEFEKDNNMSVIKINKHDGQRKLFMAGLRFLNRIPISNDKTKLIIYVGAAPGMHIYTLASLRPDLKFLLVDPNEFFLIVDRKNDKVLSHYDAKLSSIIYLYSTNISMYNDYGSMKNMVSISEREVLHHDMKNYIKGSGPNINESDIMSYIYGSKANIFLYENYFTNDLAKTLKETCPDDMETYLMSDIRTSMSGTNSPNELDILWDNAMMMGFIDALSPKMICHKHRPGWTGIKIEEPTSYMLPTFEHAKEIYDIDLIDDFKNGKLTYFAGTIYMQPWTTSHSTETRLIAHINEDTGKYNLCEYDLHEYDIRMNYYNTVVRTSESFNNDALKCTCMNNICEKTCKVPVGIDHCADCSLEADILYEYGMRGERLANFMVGLHIYLSPGSANIASLHNRETKKNKHHVGKHISPEFIKK